MDHISDNKLNLIAVTEAWLSRLSPALGLPTTHSMVHVPRPNKKDGGVAIIQSKSLSVKIMSRPQAASYESMAIELLQRSSLVKLIVIYRLPKSKSKQFVSEFENLLDILMLSSGKILIVGDFNYQWNKPHHPIIQKLMDSIDSHNLIQHVSDATHSGGHILDWIMLRSSDDLISHVKVSSLISDHLVVHATCNLPKSSLPPKSISYRQIHKINLESFEEDIKSSTLVTDPPNNINDLLSQYNATLLTLLNKHAPLKTKTITLRQDNPWYTEEINIANKLRRQLEKKWRRTRLHIHKEIYQNQKQAVSNLISQAKVSYFNEKIKDCGDDQRALFKLVNNLQEKVKELHLPSHDSLQDHLNSFFAFFHEKILKIKTGLEAPLDTTNDQYTFVLPIKDQPPEETLCSFRTATDEEVVTLITKSPTKSCCLDPIPTSLLKSSLNALVPTLTRIINLSPQTAVF